MAQKRRHRIIRRSCSFVLTGTHSTICTQMYKLSSLQFNGQSSSSRKRNTELSVELGRDLLLGITKKKSKNIQITDIIYNTRYL